jgi:hypothetical protein
MDGLTTGQQEGGGGSPWCANASEVDKGFGAAAFTGEESRMVAGDDGKELLQVSENDKGVRDKLKWKEVGRSMRRQLSLGAGEAAMLSRDSDELWRRTSGAAVEEEG